MVVPTTTVRLTLIKYLIELLLYGLISVLTLTQPQSLHHGLFCSTHIHYTPQFLDAAVGQKICGVCLSCNMYDVTIIPLQYLYPLPYPPIHCRLVWKIFQRVMVGLYHEVGSCKIVPPLPDCTDDT